METRKIIGSKIKELRENNQMSQEDLSKILKISQASLARYEQGIRCPNEDQLAWLADHFGVSLDWIFGRTNRKVGGMIIKKSKEQIEWEKTFKPGHDFYDFIKKTVEEMCEKQNKKEK